MEKILILLICVFSLAQAENAMGEKHDNIVVYTETKGDIDTQLDINFNDGVSQTVECWTGEVAQCDVFFNDTTEIWLNRTTDNLQTLYNEWKKTNTELKENVNKAKHLFVQQEILLGVQQKKILRLKEISFNLQKAIDLNVAQIELLQTKKRLNDKMFAK